MRNISKKCLRLKFEALNKQKQEENNMITGISEYKEIWKDIPDYEGLYQASTFGRVRSLPRNTTKGKILSHTYNHSKYYLVILCKNGKCKGYSVHRLVWLAFNGKIPEGMQVNHINEDKTDNRLSNLNLMSQKENTNWGTRNERISNKLKNGKCAKSVYQYSLDGKLVKEWQSVREIQRVLGFNITNINSCCLNKKYRHTAYGYMWKYNEIQY